MCICLFQLCTQFWDLFSKSAPRKLQVRLAHIMIIIKVHMFNHTSRSHSLVSNGKSVPWTCSMISSNDNSESSSKYLCFKEHSKNTTQSITGLMQSYYSNKTFMNLLINHHMRKCSSQVVMLTIKHTLFLTKVIKLSFQ